MNMEEDEESPVSLIGRREPLTDSSKSYYFKTMSVSDVVAEIEGGEFDLYYTTSTDPTLFYRTCLYDNHKKTECQQIWSLTSFIHTQNRSFQHF